MTALSLHIGLNRVSAAHYGAEHPLRSAVADARSMQAIADAGGFTSILLTDDQATAVALAEHVSDAARQLAAGDTFFLSYAGHGSQLFDGSGEEPDSLDETWCVFDRMMIDDELRGLYYGFEPGVRVLIVSDSCHSASIGRELWDVGVADFTANGVIAVAPPPFEDVVFRRLDEAAARTAFENDPERYREANALSAANALLNPRCAIQVLAACQDNQLAADGPGHGYFTQQLLYHWNDGSFAGSYADLFQVIQRAMPRTQQPNRDLLGENNAAFLNGRPFST